MSKTVYMTYKQATNGRYFDAMIVPDDFTANYPMIEATLPTDIALPFWDWDKLAWIDYSAEAAKLKQAESDEKIAELEADVEALDAKAEQVNYAALQTQNALLELSDLVLASGTGVADDANA